MKITRQFIRNLIKEAVGDKSCPAPTQDKGLNEKNKTSAAKSKKIKYGDPAKITELQDLAAKGSLCGNCAAFNISEQMINCGGASSDGSLGYCMMHEFTCSAKKTCLTWAKGGPKKG